MKRSLSERICKRLEMTVSAFRQDCRFSVRLALYRMIDDLTWRAGLKRISTCFHDKKDRYIQDYLEKLLQPVIERYVDDHELGEQVENAPIWVCWWNGEDAAPPLVRQCIQSIRKQAGNQPVHLITGKTYAEYLELPSCFRLNIENGTMGFAHLADYIRVTLLAQYGGLWLDATMFCAEPLPELCFSLPVFTCKSELIESRYLSKYQWVTFCLGGYKGNVFYRFLKDAFEAYWRSHAYAIDYLFFDHMIHLAQEKIPAIRACLKDVPVNNVHRDDLQAAMNAALPAEAFESVLHEDTTLYKLSWRETYSVETEDGRPSVYAHFLKMVM